VPVIGSLPFKGRARVGMGYGSVKDTAISVEIHPHPDLPLEGEGVKSVNPQLQNLS